MGEGAALAKSDHAGDRAVAGHARLRRRRRADQHELSARRQHPQHAVDHRAFPPDLRRRHRDHVFRDRLRSVAASDRPRARQFRADADPALAVVHRHDRHHVPVALCRHSRHAAPHGVLRLRQSRDLAAGVFGCDVGDRRIHSADLGHPVSRRADPRPDGAGRPRRAPIGSACPCTCRRGFRWR